MHVLPHETWLKQSWINTTEVDAATLSAKRYICCGSKKPSFFGRQNTPSDCEQALICSCNSLIFAKQAIHREHLTGLQSLNELQIFTAEYAVSPQVIVQLYRAAGKKLLATSLHAD